MRSFLFNIHCVLCVLLWNGMVLQFDTEALIRNRREYNIHRLIVNWRFGVPLHKYT